MGYLPYIIGLLAFGCVFILATQYFSYREKQRFIKKRFVPTEGQEVTKPLWLKPLFKYLAPLNARIGSKTFREKLERDLLSAGAPLTADEYLVFKELLVIFAPLILGFFIEWPKLLAQPLLIILACGLGFIYPSLWLKTRIEKRKREILRTLPNVIDLLILAVDAGLDFMIALRRIVERAQPGPVVEELSQLYHEVQMGRIRREALKNLAQRLNIPEVHSFSRTLIQAERMGTPMGEALRSLSEEIRIRQFQRGEQQALKAPIKMLFPLLFCILPVVLILVGGPVILQFFQSGLEFFK